MDDIRLLTKIATLYYRGGWRQEQIASRLGVSRQTVGRHLKRAEKLGIVEIKIKSSLLFSTELEYALEKAFQLSEAIVVTPPADTEDSIKRALGEAGAAFLVRRIQHGDIIGISWSSTVLQCAMQLQGVAPRRITVVQMNGSLDRTSYSTRAEYTVDRIAQAFDGTPVALVAPMLVDRPDIKASLLSDSRIAAALEMASKANVALFGVGDVSKRSSLYKTGYLDNAMLKRLKGAGAVGDICGRFYDPGGKACIPELDECTLAIELNNLRSKRLAIAVAGGLHKTDALLGMLRGQYCNVLITDEETAKMLLAQTSLKGEKGGNASARA